MTTSDQETPALNIDPTTLAVIRGAFTQIASEMDLTVVRSAFSPVITEMADRASGLYESESGATIAQGAQSLPVFVCTMQYALEHLLSKLRERDELDAVRDGDIYAFNDPYYGGTHVQDFKLFTPFFWEGKRFCWLGTTGHWLDMGGGVPGSFVPSATECYVEGLRVPPVQIWSAGRPRHDVIDMIMQNVRVPSIQIGDLEAMVNALRVGKQRLVALLTKYGRDTVKACIAELRSRSQGQMESIISEMPEGTYEFEDFIDSDGIDGEPLKVHLSLTIRGSRAMLDFSESSPPARGPMNLAWNTTVSGALIAVKHLFPEVPINAGCFAPFEFEIPTTTFLHATRPRAVGGYLEIIGRVITVVLGAFSRAIPDRVPADWFGTSLALTVAGDAWKGGPFVGTFPFAGGMGAFRGADGLVNAPSLQGLAHYPVIETTEQRWPLLFRQLALREDSGGDGQYRGGPGTTYEIEAFRRPVRMTILGDRAKFAPYGVERGTAAQGTDVVFIREGKSWVPRGITKAENVAMLPGDRVILKSPGGGGWGPAEKRSIDAVRDDIANGYISRKRAAEVYRVVIDEQGESQRHARNG